MSISIIVFATCSAASVRCEFPNYGVGQWANAIAFLLPTGAICAWPWLLAFSRAFHEKRRVVAIVFSIVGMLLAVQFYSPISRAPIEGIGYNIIFFVLATWVIYPVLVLLGTRLDDK
ncbi:MAG: hypothetical protein JNJ55_06225 [Betaproteobacteria bacterium]|nr:hypothetical protein [Betaproteobacteria bacterium]